MAAGVEQSHQRLRECVARARAAFTHAELRLRKGWLGDAGTKGQRANLALRSATRNSRVSLGGSSPDFTRLAA
jgi:hypothetical protein